MRLKTLLSPWRIAAPKALLVIVALTSLHLSAWAQTAGAPVAPVLAPTPSLVEATTEGTQRVYRLVRAVSVVGDLVCGTNTLIRVAPAPDESPMKRTSEAATILVALQAGRKLVLQDGRCGSDGSLMASSLAMQSIDQSAAVCTVPLPGRAPGDCGR